MLFNLFATGVLLSMTSALELEASASALALLETEAEAGAGSHRDDGTIETYYMRPEDNCCYFYRKQNFEQMYDVYKEYRCWDTATGLPSKKFNSFEETQ